LIPPEITTLKKEDTTVQADTEVPSATTTSKKNETATQEITEPTATVKGTNEIDVVVHQNIDGKRKIGCKQGEFLPSTYCNKVS